jgi:probable rRNA maturation factor
MTGARRTTGTRERRRPRLRIDILVEAGDWPNRRELRQVAARALFAAAAKSGVDIAPESELSLVFTDDAHIRKLNRGFRRKDKATNVLSFPAPPPGGGNRFGPLLGDIVIAKETVAREAADQGLTLDHHLTHLIVHGFLHLIGHDHAIEAEAVVMERLETAILAGIGVADPYADGNNGSEP